MMEWPAIAAIAAVASFGIALTTFWVRYTSRLTKAEGDATAALADSKEANERAQLLSTSFGLYREQVARDYIHREVMREVEDRLTQAIDRLGDRLDRVLERAGK